MITTKIKGIELKLETHSKVFSPKAPDCGTLAMLSVTEFKEQDKVLDLGCGYGLVGILAAKLIGEKRVVLCDNSPEAVCLSRSNAQINNVEAIRIIESNGLNAIPDADFTLILSNPPYHTDFSVPKQFIEEGYKRLLPGGRIIMVTKRKEWYKNKLISVFGGVKITEQDGYFIFMAEKKDQSYYKKKTSKTKTMSKKLTRKYGK